MKKKPSNLILLTHKCGNSYFHKVLRKENNYFQFQSEDIIRHGEMPGQSINRLKGISRPFYNVRCRNFDTITTMKALDLVDLKRTQIFLCVRHPASFFRSATKYHENNPEKWSQEQRYSHLDNQTLHEALVREKDEDNKLIISMKHFGLAWRLPFRWASNYEYIKSTGKEVTILKTEDLFKNGTDSYFEKIAATMSHDGYAIDASRLIKKSPISMKALSKHSTGEFQKDFFDGFGQKAMEFYNAHFKQVEIFFYPQ